MKGIVWCTKMQEGIPTFEEIISKYGFATEFEWRSPYRYEVQFENGDIWKLVSAKDSSRGLSCNISYISKDIPENIVHDIILPCTKASPFQAIHYYWPRKDDEDERNLK